MLPLFLVLGVVGPLLTLIVVMWLWHLLTRQRARVRVGLPEPTAAGLDGEGQPVFPANVPYCPEHALIHPPDRVTCQVDRADLAIRCPVDGTVRAASIQTCTACGTRFILGKGRTPLLVERSSRPPDGGAAVA
jgi:hypothetical protein